MKFIKRMYVDRNVAKRELKLSITETTDVKPDLVTGKVIPTLDCPEYLDFSVSKLNTRPVPFYRHVLIRKHLTRLLEFTIIRRESPSF